ncbi:MAG: sodium-translocating pyrophosphatase, partial [Pedobacter sp.]
MDFLQNNLIYSIPLLGIIGILVMAVKSAWVNKQDAGDANMQELAGYIADGAMAFLKAEWKVLSIFAVFTAALLVFLSYFNVIGADGVVSVINMKTAIEVLTGFSLGAESIALFARVGGGIYTKAADVGADLVGKVEAGIPEDDVRNPATIADNVGDNVGDVAGMGADLFGSYVATILATMVLGQEITVTDKFGGMSPILLPMVICGLGIIFSIIGTWFVTIKDEKSNVQSALNLGNWSSIVITAISSFFIVKWMLPETLNLRGYEFSSMNVFYAIMVGLVVGTIMSIVTEYYTAMGKAPVNSIIQQSSTG